MIERDVYAEASTDRDVIVIGGGIHGVCVCDEAARRGHRVLLIERDDFGAHTSFSSLRIIHGGLRYLQQLDVSRLRESVRETRWHLRRFPGLVRPLRCVMPLTGRGLRRPIPLRLALWVYRWLSLDRNRGVPAGRALPAGAVVNADELTRICPRLGDLPPRGAVVWYDAMMLSPQRMLMSLLRSGCRLGARSLNYVEAVELAQHDGRVNGVIARDRIGGGWVRFRAPVVINCAGPWCADVASEWDPRSPPMFERSLALNILLNHKPFAEGAVAVQPEGGHVAANAEDDGDDAGTLLLLPCHGRLLCGTRHVPLRPGDDITQRVRDGIERMLSDLSSANLGLAVSRTDVRRVYAGQLPAVGPGSCRVKHRSVVHDHGCAGGPRGLWSVSGVKWTTARAVAERVVKRALGARRRAGVKAEGEFAALSNADGLYREAPRMLRALAERVLVEESVVHLDDLVLRRMDGVLDEETLTCLIDVYATHRHWEPATRRSEMTRLAESLESIHDPLAGCCRSWLARDEAPVASRTSMTRE